MFFQFLWLALDRNLGCSLCAYTEQKELGRTRANFHAIKTHMQRLPRQLKIKIPQGMVLRRLSEWIQPWEAAKMLSREKSDKTVEHEKYSQGHPWSRHHCTGDGLNPYYNWSKTCRGSSEFPQHRGIFPKEEFCINSLCRGGGDAIQDSINKFTWEMLNKYLRCEKSLTQELPQTWRNMPGSPGQTAGKDLQWNKNKGARRRNTDQWPVRDEKAIQNLSLLNHRSHTEVMNTEPVWWRLFCWKQRTYTDKSLGNQSCGETPICWGSPYKREAKLNPKMIPPFLLYQE